MTNWNTKRKEFERANDQSDTSPDATNSIQKFENRNPIGKADQDTDKMAPKQTKATTAKTKELQSAETPLMIRLRNIKNAKVQ